MAPQPTALRGRHGCARYQRLYNAGCAAAQRRLGRSQRQSASESPATESPAGDLHVTASGGAWSRKDRYARRTHQRRGERGDESIGSDSHAHPAIGSWTRGHHFPTANLGGCDRMNRAAKYAPTSTPIARTHPT